MSPQVFVYFFISAFSIVQAAVSTEGTKFLLYFAEGSRNSFPPRSVDIYITTRSTEVISVNITTPAWTDPDTVNQTLQVALDSPTVASLPPTVRSTEIGRESKAVLVEASGQISVFGLNPSQNQIGLFAVFPVSSVGTEYIFPSFTNFHVASQGFMGIVPEQDQTELDVLLPDSPFPQVATIQSTPYGPKSHFRTMLNKYQMVEVRQNVNCPKCDLTGSRITATKPVAVFSVVSLSSPLSPGTGGDMLVEQILPVTSWGRTYITMTSPDFAAGNTVRVMAGEQKVTVYQYDNMETFTLTSAGDFKDILVKAGEHLMIQADGKIQVIQYSSSTPFMLIVTSLEHFTQSAYVPTVVMDTTSSTSQHHAVAIVTRVCDADRLYVNSTLVRNMVPWQNLGTTDFVVATIPARDAGFHRIYGEAGSDVSFGGYVYGRGDIMGYAAPLAVEENKMVERYLWAEPSAMAIHKANQANTDGIQQQAWRLVERDVTSSQKPLRDKTVNSPIACFQECSDIVNCKYATVFKNGKGRQTCRLFDNRMTCTKRDPLPGARTYTSRLNFFFQPPGWI